MNKRDAKKQISPNGRMKLVINEDYFNQFFLIWYFHLKVIGSFCFSKNNSLEPYWMVIIE